MSNALRILTISLGGALAFLIFILSGAQLFHGGFDGLAAAWLWLWRAVYVLAGLWIFVGIGAFFAPGRGRGAKSASSFLRALAMGAAAGVAAAVTPSELLCLLVPPAAFVTFAVGWDRGGPGPVALGVVAAAAVVVAASLTPLKPVDRRVELAARAVTIGEAVSALQGHDFTLRPETKALVVELPSTRVSFRDLFEAARSQHGIAISLGYCGNGASFLLGGYPLGAWEKPASPR